MRFVIDVNDVYLIDLLKSSAWMNQMAAHLVDAFCSDMHMQVMGPPMGPPASVRSIFCQGQFDYPGLWDINFLHD